MSQKIAQKKGNQTKTKSKAIQKHKVLIPLELKDMGTVTAIMNERNVDTTVLGNLEILG